VKPWRVANIIANSPITLTADPDTWATDREVPFAVQDSFGPKASIVSHQGRWRGLVAREGGSVFAWFDGRKLVASGVVTPDGFAQSLESDPKGRALVIGGAGNGCLYAVDPSGAAACLGVLAEGQKIATACWLADGGVAFLLGATLCIYRPDSEGRLRPQVRFESTHCGAWGLRSLPHDNPEVIVLVALEDDRGAIYAITPDARVHTLAAYEKLEFADVRLCLDETGQRMLLPDGPIIANGPSLTEIGGIAEALGVLDALPLVEPFAEPAPEFAEGPDLPAPGPDAVLEVRVEPVADAHVAPKLERLGTLTAALIKMLRAGHARSSADPEILKLIRAGMPVDLRAYVHAWAMYEPKHQTVYEFWMGPPKLVNDEYIRKHTGEALKLGTFASGEPILGCLGGSGYCSVVMIDEEGLPYRYSGIEGFLRDLQMRAPEGAVFELDAWIGGSP
jgi:hypothetical protein